MNQSWVSFQAALRARHKEFFYGSKEDFARFDAFVDQLPAAERIPMLLDAYQRYRALNVCGDPRGADQFETSCWSILISTILRAKIRPDHSEAIQILQSSYHACGHGCDVEPPLTLAEQAFERQPYSTALFDAVYAYRETLRPSRGTHATNVKCKLSWILWHDPRRMEKSCHTRKIQQAIHSMDAEQAFHWQWLLRNSASGLNSAPGKSWVKEGQRRLASIGEERFFSALDGWSTFPQDEIKVSAAGSAMLRLLVWYGALVNVERSLPVLIRLARVSWNKRSPVGKVMAALAWTLRTHGGIRFAEEARLICAKWAGDNSEVKRLEAAYFPDEAGIRQQSEEESLKHKNAVLKTQMEAMLQTFRAQHPNLFGPDSATASLFAAREKMTASTEPGTTA